MLTQASLDPGKNNTWNKRVGSHLKLYNSSGHRVRALRNTGAAHDESMVVGFVDCRLELLKFSEGSLATDES